MDGVGNWELYNTVLRNNHYATVKGSDFNSSHVYLNVFIDIERYTWQYQIKRRLQVHAWFKSNSNLFTKPS